MPRIELGFHDWQSCILPLNYICKYSLLQKYNLLPTKISNIQLNTYIQQKINYLSFYKVAFINYFV